MNRKLTIQTIAMGNLKHRRRQYVSLVFGIVLAMIFSCGVPFFLSCSRASREELRSREMGRQDVMILDAPEVNLDLLYKSGYLEEDPGFLHVISYGWTDEPQKGTAVGWLDERAAQLYYLQIQEGRMPQNPGEIAIEHSTLLRLGLENAQIGEAVTLHETAADETGYLAQTEDHTYTLVGILENRKSNLERTAIDRRNVTEKVPSAFVAPGTQPALGGKENQIALAYRPQNYEEIIFSWEEANLDYSHEINTDYHNPGINVSFSRVANSTQLSISIALGLAFLSCFGIVNAFASNLKERKKQIGLLRAVGATRRQIIRIFGREALLIALVCTPVSVLTAYWGVKLFALKMGDYFVFMPSPSVLLESAAFGFVVVLLSALVPLWSVSRIPPMQAIRDTELVRKMKHKRVHSQKHFRMNRLLAKRKLLFQRGRMFAVSLILAFTVLISNVAVGSGIQLAEKSKNLHQAADYRVSLNGVELQANAYVNQPMLNDAISELQRQEALQLPYVSQISGQKHCHLNLLVDGEFPEYLTLNEYRSWNRGRFLEPMFGVQLSLTRENLHRVMQTRPNPDYAKTRQWAGYAQDIFAADVLVRGKTELQQLQEAVIEGTINLEKLDAGEEIILNAPPKIGFYYHAVENGFSLGILDITEKGLASMEKWKKEKLPYIVGEAESPYHAGDTVTLSMLVSGPDGQPVRMDREVKIGAILNQNSDMELYTTVQGLDQFGQTIGYDWLDISLNRPVTAEIDQEMQAVLEAVFPGKEIWSEYAAKQQSIAEFRSQVLTGCALILTLCVVSILLVNNSISGQIREGKRTIGTLRAVGASQRDIVRSYVWQILAMTVAGTLLGIAGYTVLQGICYYRYEETLGAFVLWPTPLLFCAVFGICWLHLVGQIRKISRQSIVDNIREL